MTNYYKVMLGKGSQHAQQAIQESYIGVGDGVGQDLTPLLPLSEPEFRDQVKVALQIANPSSSKGTISQYATTLWRIAEGIQVGDVVLCPTGQQGQLQVGDVTGLYQYRAGNDLPHRRAVSWRPGTIKRADMTTELQNSSGGITTIIDLTGYASEIEALIGGPSQGVGQPPASTDPAFLMEKELESFLVANWQHTELGAQYDLYRNDAGDPVGQQYQTIIGIIDILAVKKDGSEVLVIELKRGKATDQVVGQIQRYMGFIKKEVAEAGQQVRGIIIALSDDERLQYALEVAPNISFYIYKVSFQLQHTGGLPL